MANPQNTQAGAAKAPPIPSMDVSPPPSATSQEIRQQVRDIAQRVKAEAQNAKKAGQDAKQAAQVSGQIATTAPPSPVINPGDIIPQQAVDISLAFFLTVAFCVVGFPIARAVARRLDRKTEFKSVAGPDLAPQIRQLQDSVDAMAIELERISEGQRFTSRLLAERSGAGTQQQ